MANEDKTRVIGRVDENGRAFVATDQFRTALDDGTRVKSVTIGKVEDRWILRVSGKKSLFRCRSIATSLDLGPDGALRLSSAEEAATDSCEGTLCSSCSLTYEGFQAKCSCNDWFGWCNHTTTSLTELPEVLTILEG